MRMANDGRAHDNGLLLDPPPPRPLAILRFSARNLLITPLAKVKKRKSMLTLATCCVRVCSIIGADKYCMILIQQSGTQACTHSTQIEEETAHTQLCQVVLTWSSFC